MFFIKWNKLIDVFMWLFYRKKTKKQDSCTIKELITIATRDMVNLFIENKEHCAGVVGEYGVYEVLVTDFNKRKH